MKTQPENALASTSNTTSFIRNTFLILTWQLILTFGFVLVVALVPDVNEYAQNHIWIFLVGFGLSFPALFLCIWKPNIWTLLVFTLAETMLLGGATCFVEDSNVIVYSIVLTLTVSISLIVFAMQTRYDFLGWGPYLFMALIALLVTSILFAIVQVYTIWFCYLGVVLFSLLLVYDTQRIVKGTHRHANTESSAVEAAIALYLDILNIFVRLLSILSKK